MFVADIVLKMIGLVFLFLIVSTCGRHVDEKVERGASSYDYSATGKGGPQFWKTLFPSYCAGTKQSPINLKDAESKTCEPFQFTGYDVLPANMDIANNGHTAKLALTMDPMPTVSGGCLDGTYEFLQLHWHWGSSSDKGSEHLINDSPYSIELHLVHWNTKYSSVNEALGQADGLAVLGIMGKETLSSSSGSPYSNIAKVLKNIRQSSTTSSVTPFKLQDFLPASVSTYYRYSGSLTTPKCNEIVTWTVFEDSIQISKEDINEFRQLLDSEGKSQSNNFRPVQPLNGRTVSLISS